MQPKIKTISQKKLVGMHMETCLADDNSGELWQRFMPRKKEIKNGRGSGLYSVQEYSEKLDFDDFTPDIIFSKWAAVEVDSFDHIPQGMKSHILTGGKYAVFIHKGLNSTFHKLAEYIYGTWLPNSEYKLDHREHFEFLGENYLGPMNPESEEEVWIPIS